MSASEFLGSCSEFLLSSNVFILVSSSDFLGNFQKTPPPSPYTFPYNGPLTGRSLTSVISVGVNDRPRIRLLCITPQEHIYSNHDSTLGV